MFASLLGGMIDKEGAIKNTLNATLERLSKEYNCSLNDVMIMIKGEVQEEDSAFFVCNVFVVEGGRPVKKREIKVKEIIGD